MTEQMAVLVSTGIVAQAFILSQPGADPITYEVTTTTLALQRIG
jgi:hypothetical protein